MFLRQFRYLLAVVDEQHFGRAADRCNVTQPSLSTGIKQLEFEIGVPIFLRGRGQRFHGLTAEGERVVNWARNIVGHCEAMRDEIAAMRSNLSGRLRMGAMPSMSPVLPVLLRRLRSQHPNVTMDVRFIGNDAMKVGLNNFSLDVALTYLGEAEMGRRNTLRIYTETLSLLAPDTPAFAGRDRITWREVAGLPLAMLRHPMHERRFVDGIFASIGLQPQPRVESESILHLMFQVQFGDLCTIIPSHFARMPGLHPGTRAIELVDPVASQEVCLFWAEGEIITPMANALVSVVKDLNRQGGLDATLSEAVPDRSLESTPRPHPIVGLRPAELNL